MEIGLPEMKILVTGANGQLGSWMRILSAGSADSFLFTDVALPTREQTEIMKRTGGPDVPCGCEILDITEISAIRGAVKRFGADVIVNCAAYTNVDAAEDNEALAERLNAWAPACLAEVAKESGALLVHISTDYVIGADPYNTPCTEDRPGTPSGVYGRTKLLGEKNILASGCKAVIIRTAWLYSEFGKNFLKTMIELTGSRPEVKVVFDQTGTPTYAADLAGAVMTIIDDYRKSGRGAEYARSGLYNYSNEGVCSWYDFAHTIAMLAGHDGCSVLPCHSGEFPSKVRRPSYSVLDKTRIKEVFGMEIPYWLGSLCRCMARLSATFFDASGETGPGD